MATESFFESGVINDKNKEKFFKMLRSKEKYPAASDKDFIKVTDKEEIKKLMKGMMKKREK